MKKIYPLIILVAVLVLLGFQIRDVGADTITLSATNASTASFDVPSNSVAQVVYSSGFGSSATYLCVTIFGIPNLYQANNSGILINAPTITGPATISFTNTLPISSAPRIVYCTIQTTPATSATTNFVPSNAVVIPADNGGPVTIVLESSIDLVNWTSALPGTYGTSSSNRFFRVRAQR